MRWWVLFALLILKSCNYYEDKDHRREIYLIISPEEYKDKLHGFWLAQCIGNWTGLITEMDKIGNIGDIKTGDFYTRNDWKGKDQPNIWTADKSSQLDRTIDYVLAPVDSIWGADDDTDIEYMYQYLLNQHNTSFLTPEQIRNGWLKHIHKEEENFLWVSNQKAFDLMEEGLLPPETGLPTNNEHYEMIDAQLTTEIFGLFAPGNPQLALDMAELPIRTTAYGPSEEIAKFYVILYSLAANIQKRDESQIKASLIENAQYARTHLTDSLYPAKMYDFVKELYDQRYTWEQTRDSIYYRYQVLTTDGYDITKQQLYCNGCFAAGINFASSLVSYFYGEGDLKKTIKIGTLAGWDSDNPTATWSGMLGFIYGKKKVEEIFGRDLSSRYNIHRTRTNFDNSGIDNFYHMADVGVRITQRTITAHAQAKISQSGFWHIPVNL